MSDVEQRVCDAEQMAVLIAGLACKLWETRRQHVPLYLVGVRSRGVPLAERLAKELRTRFDYEAPIGAIEITLYRDDLGRGRSWPVLRGTDIPFSVEGAEVVLVDDVLFTGRTIRAALNAICDLGRPACIRLAVLVDRGHREIPIQADFLGLRLPTERRDRVRVRIQPHDKSEEIIRVKAAADPSQSERSPAP